jgi:LmbE family N-acetylglucosaminyl deacetylase
MTLSSHAISNTSLSPNAEEILEWLVEGENPSFYKGIIVAAHPDDEFIGISSRLGFLRRSILLHTTDGSPENLHDAQAHGYTTCREYSEARRGEFFRALELSGAKDISYRCLEFPDQQSAFHLSELTLKLLELALNYQPQFILTHPYEGGHPDHDAASFAVHNVCRLMQKRALRAPAVIEFTSYHNGPNGINTGTFLNKTDREKAIPLTSEDRDRKTEIFKCFRTQEQVLRWFPIGPERLRLASTPDFTAPPHEGTLFYEQFPWGMNRFLWGELATQALHTLGLEKERL